MKNKIDKFRHLACIQYEIRNAVAYDCRDVAIILRLLKFKKSQSTHAFHYERKKSFRTDVCSGKEKERQNQIMKFKASGIVHYVNMTSLIFDVIGLLYPKDKE